MSVRAFLVCCALAGIQIAAANVVTADSGKNPIRRVVSMLQSMAKKVEAEGKKRAGTL
jgi:hypothetical protein